MRYSGFPAKRTAALFGDVAAASSDLFNINTRTAANDEICVKLHIFRSYLNRFFLKV